MKKSKFTDSQITGAPKQAENGIPMSQICRDLGGSSATFYKWRAKYGCISNAVDEIIGV